MSDAIVIGGGVIGLLCARELRRAGLDVMLVERDRPGKQASWASAGILTVAAPLDPTPTASLKRLSAELYPELVAALREESGVDPEYTWPGHLVPAMDDGEADALRAVVEQDRRRGLDTELLTGSAVREAEPVLAPSVVAAQLRPGGQIDNRRLCRALELAERRAGVSLMYGATATEVLTQAGRVTGLRTHIGEFRAPIVVNAAGSWSGQLGGCEPSVPVSPQRGEILALDHSIAALQRVVTKPFDPYLVPRADGRLVVGATRKYVGYDGSFTAGGLAWLLNEAIGLVPALAEAPVVETWTGFRPNSPDGLPIIGRGGLDGLFFATGHGPSGIAPAPATARVLAALIEGSAPPVPVEPFDPMRFADRTVDVDSRTWRTQGGHRV